MLLTATLTSSPGNSPAIRTRFLLISRILLTCSISAGHISWQARQVVHDQSTSVVTVSTRLAWGLVNATSPICCTTFMGERGFSVDQAGQRSWHRLQLVQASASKISFQERSATLSTP